MLNNYNEKTNGLTYVQKKMNEKQTLNTSTNDNNWITGSWLGTGTYIQNVAGLNRLAGSQPWNGNSFLTNQREEEDLVNHFFLYKIKYHIFDEYFRLKHTGNETCLITVFNWGKTDFIRSAMHLDANLYVAHSSWTDVLGHILFTCYLRCRFTDEWLNDVLLWITEINSTRHSLQFALRKYLPAYTQKHPLNRGVICRLTSVSLFPWCWIMDLHFTVLQLWFQ